MQKLILVFLVLSGTFGGCTFGKDSGGSAVRTVAVPGQDVAGVRVADDLFANNEERDQAKVLIYADGATTVGVADGNADAAAVVDATVTVAQVTVNGKLLALAAIRRDGGAAPIMDHRATAVFFAWLEIPKPFGTADTEAVLLEVLRRDMPDAIVSNLKAAVQAAGELDLDSAGVQSVRQQIRAFLDSKGALLGGPTAAAPSYSPLSAQKTCYNASGKVLQTGISSAQARMGVQIRFGNSAPYPRAIVPQALGAGKTWIYESGGTWIVGAGYLPVPKMSTDLVESAAAVWRSLARHVQAVAAGDLGAASEFRTQAIVSLPFLAQTSSLHVDFEFDATSQTLLVLQLLVGEVVGWAVPDVNTPDFIQDVGQALLADPQGAASLTKLAQQFGQSPSASGAYAVLAQAATFLSNFLQKLPAHMAFKHLVATGPKAVRQINKMSKDPVWVAVVALVNSARVATIFANAALNQPCYLGFTVDPAQCSTDTDCGGNAFCSDQGVCAVCQDECSVVANTCSADSLQSCTKDSNGCYVLTAQTCALGCSAGSCNSRLCNNGNVETGEACDSDTVSCSSLSSSYASGNASCNNSCTSYDTNSCTVKSCIDFDGDSHNVYSALNCPSGTDYCDSDGNNWTTGSCSSCADTDADGWYSGCDRYSSISGPDNCASDGDNWTVPGCNSCVDNDGDGYGVDCDRGPDCNDNNAGIQTGCDTTPPQTTIDSGPSGTTSATSASFAFSSNETGSTFWCQLDSSGWTTCTSPKAYNSLAVGSYTFAVSAVDAAGNVDATPASRSWTVSSSGGTGGPGAQWQSIPGGTFSMGDALGDGYSDELPVHTVTISAFEMMSYQVTNGTYADCVAASSCTAPGSTGSYSGTRSPYYGNVTYADYPVIYVNWSQATAYCSWAGGRLPTEAEWEYAARGGLSGQRFPWGNTIDCSRANYYSDTSYAYDTQGSTGVCASPYDTTQVGSYAANGYGLYDMTGNVFDWVNDWYSSTYYGSSPGTDPQGPATGSYRVIGGGSFDYGALFARVAYRYVYYPTSQYYNIGFRCAR